MPVTRGAQSRAEWPRRTSTGSREVLRVALKINPGKAVPGTQGGRLPPLREPQLRADLTASATPPGRHGVQRTPGGPSAHQGVD